MGKTLFAVAVLAGLGLAAWNVTALTQTQIDRKEAVYEARHADINEQVCGAETKDEFSEAFEALDDLNSERAAWYESHGVGEYEWYDLECGEEQR